MTTNTSLGVLTVGNLRGDPKMPSSLSTATHCVDASVTCCTLRVAPPPLAGIRGHRQLDPQSLAAAGRMVDRGINHLVNGVEQTGDILQNKGGRGESLQITKLLCERNFITELQRTVVCTKAETHFQCTFRKKLLSLCCSKALCIQTLYHKPHASKEFKDESQAIVKTEMD